MSDKRSTEGPAGLEPATNRLTTGRSTVELRTQIAGGGWDIHRRMRVRRPRAGPIVADQARAKSLMTAGVAVSKPTTSSMPASFGSAMLNPFEVIPTTTTFAAMPRA